MSSLYKTAAAALGAELLFYILLTKLKSCPVKVWITVRINESQKRFGVPERERFKLRQNVQKSQFKVFQCLLFFGAVLAVQRVNAPAQILTFILTEHHYCQSAAVKLRSTICVFVWTTWGETLTFVIATMHPSLLLCLFSAPDSMCLAYRVAILFLLLPIHHLINPYRQLFKSRHIPPISARSFSLSKILVFALEFLPCARLNSVNPVCRHS